MVDKKRKVPNLRFKGFTNDWVQRKLSEVTERVTRKNKNNESTRPLTISAQDGLIDQNDFFDKQVASRDVSGYFLVKNGEFAYNKSYSNGYPWGAIKRLDHYDMGVLSTLYIVFNPTNVSSQFLVSYYDATKWYKEVAKNAAEGARNHGLLNIAPSDFFSTVLEIPTSIEEQDEIGDFLKKMDNLIAANQRKLDLLKQLKKGLLQKMFADQDRKQPVLRFKGFHDDWEQRKLGDEYKHIGNAFVGTASPYYTQNGYFYLESNNIKNGQINHDHEVFINESFYHKQLNKLLHTGDLVMVQSGHVGDTAVITEKYNGTAAHALIMFRKPKNNMLSFFLNSFFQSSNAKNRIDVLAIGNTIRHILASDMKKFVVYLPDNKEKGEVAKLFLELQKLISLQHQKLAKYQSVKKSLLQQMFI
ncbi:restriction endonuclease subunit S [Limosilactobacillus fermentum]